VTGHGFSRIDGVRERPRSEGRGYVVSWAAWKARWRFYDLSLMREKKK